MLDACALVRRTQSRGAESYTVDWLLDSGVSEPDAWRTLDWDALAAAGARPDWVFRPGLAPFAEDAGLTASRLLGNAFAVLRAIRAGLTPDELDRLAGHRVYLWFLPHRGAPPEYLDVPFVVRFRRLLAVAEALATDPEPVPGPSSDCCHWTYWLWLLLIVEDRTGLPPRAAAHWLDALRLDEGPYSNPTDPAFIDGVLAALIGWVAVTGPGGWAWADAGYGQGEARALFALPETHPGRPGRDQLAVMAALRQT